MIAGSMDTTKQTLECYLLRLLFHQASQTMLDGVFHMR